MNKKVSYKPVIAVFCLFILSMISLLLLCIGGMLENNFMFVFFFIVMILAIISGVIIEYLYFRCAYCGRFITTSLFIHAKNNIVHCYSCGKKIDFE